MICLYCHGRITVELNLLNLFSQPKKVCESCHLKLTEWRRGERCRRCRKIKDSGEADCRDCAFISRRFTSVRNIRCLLDYNSEVKMMMHRYKFVRDVALAEVMADFIDIKAWQYDVIVPIPVSDHRLQERGFNQITEVLKRSGTAYTELLATNKIQLQSERTKSERMKSDNPFSFDAGQKDVKILDKRILIVDDIYTTGITVHHAAEIIMQRKPSYIDVLTFSKA